MKNFILIFILSIFILSIVKIANAQDFQFVVFETTVTREGVETSDENPTERRFYISNVVAVPNNIRTYQTRKIVDDYFTLNLVDPLKVMGINHQYYDNNIQIDCNSVISAKDKPDAEAKRTKCLDEIKEYGKVTIYTFNWTFEAAKGLETTVPTLLFRANNAPNYQPKGIEKVGPGQINSTQKVETPKIISTQKV